MSVFGIIIVLLFLLFYELGECVCMCGVVGGYQRSVGVAKTLFYGLQALQHRGQDASGIAVLDTVRGGVSVSKNVGLVRDAVDSSFVLNDESFIGVGHNRYATSGNHAVDNVQPIVVSTVYGDVVFAYNGHVSVPSDVLEEFERVGLSDAHYIKRLILECVDELEVESVVDEFVELKEYSGGSREKSLESGSSECSVVVESGLVGKSRFEQELYAPAIDDSRDVVLSDGVFNSEFLLSVMMRVAKRLSGAFSIVGCVNNYLFAFKDAQNIRPLFYSFNRDCFLLASESSAFVSMGNDNFYNLNPGVFCVVSQKMNKVFFYDYNDDVKKDCVEKWVLFTPPKNSHLYAKENKTPSSFEQGKYVGEKSCLFERVYLSRPDSMFDGQSVFEMREKIGEFLARGDEELSVDCVIPVPETGIAAAEHYARTLNLPLNFALVKNTYIGRSFIKPTQKERETAVGSKLNIITNKIKNKKIVIVDDSIVRGTTMRILVQRLYDAGAKEVHVRIAAPIVKNNCSWGIDFGNPQNLLAQQIQPQHNINTTQENKERENKEKEDQILTEHMRKYLKVDSLKFVSIQETIQASNRTMNSTCYKCFLNPNTKQ